MNYVLKCYILTNITNWSTCDNVTKVYKFKIVYIFYNKASKLISHKY